MRRTCLFMISLAACLTGCQCCGSCGGGGWGFHPPKFGFSLFGGPCCGGCLRGCDSCPTGCDPCAAECPRGWRGFCQRARWSLTGCPPNCYSGCKDRCVTKQHAKLLAGKRLRDLRRGSGGCLSCDFKEGFEQAYVDIAEGGTGVTPAVPPARYWSFRYRTPYGHARAQEWFNGYEMGANLANADGLKFNSIATSAGGPNATGDIVPAGGFLPPPHGYEPINGGPGR